MSVKLLSHHVHSYGCRSRKVSLYVCLQCLTVAFTTAHTKALRCCSCNKLLVAELESKSSRHDMFTGWYQAETVFEVNFILRYFTRYRMNVLNRLRLKDQMSLPGLEKEE
jgi:hypothetical protein